MYAKQVTFDRVAEHLLTQSKKSQSAGGSCLYRNNQGLECAAGCLLTDRTYRKSMEGDTVDEVLAALQRDDWFGHNEQLVLERVHDVCLVAEWKYVLGSVAGRHGLDTSILKKFRRRGDKYVRVSK